MDTVNTTHIHIHADSPRQARPTRRSRRRSLLAGAALLTALAAVAACDGATSHAPLDDVDPGWTCVASGDVVHAGGTITNNSSKTSFYVVSVEFRSGQEVAQRSSSVDGVAPGQTVTVGVAADDLAATGDVSCHVSDVTRLKA